MYAERKENWNFSSLIAVLEKNGASTVVIPAKQSV